MPLCLHQARRANPLRVDPTRTSSIRRKFMAELNRRFRLLRADVRDFIVDKDALDLGESIPMFAMNVRPKEFQFNTDPQKLVAFNEWFAQQVRQRIFLVPDGTDLDTPWVAEYVESAYRRGLVNAYLASKQQSELFPFNLPGMSAEQFLFGSFAGPISIERVRLLAARVFEDLKGVTSAMSTQMSRILTQGLIDGLSAIRIAKQLDEVLESLTLTRALVIARTEIIRAHAEGQLDAFEKIGVKELSIRAEWITAGDDRVCPLCSANEGKTFEISEAHGLIPLHPNCRCTWTPLVSVPSPSR